MTGVWNEGKMSPGGRDMATSGGEREKRRPGLLTQNKGSPLLAILPPAVGTSFQKRSDVLKH